MSQHSLFEDDSRIPLADANDLMLFHHLLGNNARQSFQDCLKTIPWQQDHIRIAGKVIPIPRLQAWYGEAAYTYSGITLKPNPWQGPLAVIKQAVETRLGRTFNTALVNCYRNGQDSVDWHADDEPELGENPIIASVSLGETRSFQLRHRQTKVITKLDLPHDSLLLMGEGVQSHYDHRVPKQQGIDLPRINITFRNVIIS